MKKKLIIFGSVVLLCALYYAEFRKIRIESEAEELSLDNLEHAEGGELWDLFYKVRATIIDGRSATFEIPDDLRKLEGEQIELSGAIAFRSEGSRIVDSNHVGVTYFDLVPLLNITYGCDIVPDQVMRWTIVVNLEREWILTRTEMINAEASVRGRFRIDTSEPYNAAFFIDSAQVALLGP
jgi:hypothetical protein